MQLIKQGMEDGVIDFVDGKHIVTPFGRLELESLAKEAFPNERFDVDELDDITKRALLLTLKYVDKKGASFYGESQHQTPSN